MSPADLEYGEPEDGDEDACEHGVSLSDDCEDCDELEDDDEDDLDDEDDDDLEDDDVLD